MEGSAAVNMGELTTSITGMLSDFSVANLTTLLGAGIGICAGLVLLWFGFNYLKRKLMGALKSGKL